MASLLIDTCLNINNIPIDYTDISSVQIPFGQTITAEIRVPRNLLYSEIGSDNARSLFNLKMVQPFSGTPQTASDIEHNIDKVVIHKPMMLSFVSKIQECLKGTLDCKEYSQLQYLKADATGSQNVTGIGQAVVRILQHLFMKYILGNSTTDIVNSALNNIIRNESSAITNLMLNNEAGIQTFIESQSTPSNISVDDYSSYISTMTVSNTPANADIANRLMSSVFKASENSGLAGSDINSFKLKSAIANFLFQNPAGKLHDRNWTIDDNILYPVQFDISDNLYFTIDLDSASISGESSYLASKLPDQEKLTASMKTDAARIYFKVIVSDIATSGSFAKVTIKINNIDYNAFVSLSVSDQESLKHSLRTDISTATGIPIELITINDITEGSLNVDFTIRESSDMTAISATVAAELVTTSITEGTMKMDSLIQSVRNLPESVQSLIVPAGIGNLAPALGGDTAPSGTVKWATRIGSATDPMLSSDSLGNTYMAVHVGGARTTNVYDTNNLITSTYKDYGNTYDDTFVMKYSKNGVCEWMAYIGRGVEFSSGISVDTNDDVIIACYGSGSVTSPYVGKFTAYNKTMSNNVVSLYAEALGTPSSITLNTSSGPNYDIVIIKYSKHGYIQWMSLLSGNDKDSYPSISCDKTNSNIFITGQYTNSVFKTFSVNQSVVVLSTLNVTEVCNTFIAKYDTNGNNLWLTRISGKEPASSQDAWSRHQYQNTRPKIASDLNNNCYVVGQYAASTLNVFDAGNDNTIVSSISRTGTISEYDIFISKFNNNGKNIWTTSIGGNITESYPNVDTDLSNNVIVSADCVNSANITIFSASNNTVPLLSFQNTGANSVAIVKYNSDGDYLWSARIKNTHYMWQNAPNNFEWRRPTYTTIKTDNKCNIVVTGMCGSILLSTFNSDGSNASSIISPTPFNAVFLTKYNSSGKNIWLTSVGQVTADGNAAMPALTINTQGYMYLAGVYRDVPLNIYNVNSTSTAIVLTPAHTTYNWAWYELYLIKYKS